uniref:Uncharacterized protein n=1 Tax=Oryza barthii TaxID=65489 RepID=A0A0D3EZ49_9ORYZ
MFCSPLLTSVRCLGGRYILDNPDKLPGQGTTEQTVLKYTAAFKSLKGVKPNIDKSAENY